MDLVWICFVSVRYIGVGLIGVLMMRFRYIIVLYVPRVLNVTA
jgi:hypothetical protein